MTHAQTSDWALPVYSNDSSSRIAPGRADDIAFVAPARDHRGRDTEKAEVRPRGPNLDLKCARFPTPRPA